jgi:ankyrin repeat protein
MLHAAARDGSVEVIQLLLQRGADPNAVKRNDTLFQRQIADDPTLMALDNGHWAAADLLLPHWRPTQARLEYARMLIEVHIKVHGVSADATRLLADMDARIAKGEWIDHQ